MWYSYSFKYDPIEFIQSENPSDFFISNQLEEIFKEVFDLRGVPQNPQNHPEGDAFEHTLLTINNAAMIASRENLSLEDRLILILSATLHDIGKSLATEFKLENGERVNYREYSQDIHGQGKVISYNHDKMAMDIIDNVLNKLQLSENIKNKIKILVLLHMRPTLLSKNINELHQSSINKIKRKLIENNINPKILMFLNEADLKRAEDRNYPENHRIFFDKMEEIEYEPEINIMNGNEIIQLIEEFLGKDYNPKLIGDLIKTANQLYSEGMEKGKIIEEIKNILIGMS